MKKVLGMIGIGFIAGVAAYVLLSKKEITKENRNVRHEKSLGDDSSKHTETITSQNTIYSEPNQIQDIQDSAMGRIAVRHKEAANILKDSVATIRSRSKVRADENRDLNQLSDELNKLLSEE